MSAKSLERLLSQLEDARYRFGPDEATRVVKLLNSLSSAHFPDANSLIRFHEALMFLRAFPQGPRVLRKTEQLLNGFHKRVEALRKSGADLSPLEPLEVSGIARTQMSDTLSFDLARWLVRHMPGKVTIDWDDWDEGRAMSEILPRLLPLVEDDALVEADTPWRNWIESACPQGLKPQHYGSAIGTAKAVPSHNEPALRAAATSYPLRADRRGRPCSTRILSSGWCSALRACRFHRKRRLNCTTRCGCRCAGTLVTRASRERGIGSRCGRSFITMGR